MKRFFPLSFVVFFMIALTGCNFLTLSKGQLDPQDKCEKQSERWAKSYQQKYPSDDITYESHHNRKLNKCFILVEYSKSQLKSLKNINENKIYGSFLSRENSKTIICNVLEKKCKNEKEWDLLVKPYMDE